MTDELWDISGDEDDYLDELIEDLDEFFEETPEPSFPEFLWEGDQSLRALV